MSRRRVFADKQAKSKEKQNPTPDFSGPTKIMAPPQALGVDPSPGQKTEMKVKKKSGPDGSSELMAPVKLPSEEVDQELLKTPPPEGETIPQHFEQAVTDYETHLDQGGDATSFNGFQKAAQAIGETDKQGDQTLEDGELGLENEEDTEKGPKNEDDGAGDQGGEDGQDGGTDGEGGGEGGTDGGGDGGNGDQGNNNNTNTAPTTPGTNAGGNGGGGGGQQGGAGGGAPQLAQTSGSFGAGTEPQFSIVNQPALDQLGGVEVVHSSGDNSLVVGTFSMGGDTGGGTVQMKGGPGDDKKKDPKADPVPQDVTQEAMEPEREKCNGIIEDFKTNATSEIEQLSDLKTDVSVTLEIASTKAKGWIDGYMAREEGLIMAAYMLAQGQLLMELTLAKGEALTLKTNAETKVNTEAQKQIQAIEEAANKQFADLEAAGPKINADVAKALADGKEGMKKAATDKGKAAEAHAESRAKSYEAESVPDMSWGEKLRYGPGYEKRKRAARADAARQTGKAYTQGFMDKANEEAAAFNGAEAEVAKFVSETIQKAKQAIEDRKTKDIEAVNQRKQAALDAIQASYDGKVQAMQAEHDRVNGQLTTKMGEDQAEVRRIGEEKKGAIDTAVTDAKTKLEQSIQTAIDQFTEGANMAAQEAGNAPVPDPDSVQQALDGALDKIKSGITETKGQLTQAMTTTGASIEQMGTDTESVLSAITSNAQTQATGLVGEAKAEFRRLLDEFRDVDIATASDAAVTDMGTIATDGAKVINQLGTDTVTGLNTMVTNLQTKMEENATGLANDFQSEIDSTLDGKITEEAEKAADSVPSMWAVIVSWAVKILVAIAITAVCCALIASGAGLLTVILVGAVMGAVGGAATYMTDVGLGMQEFSWGGLGMAVGTGALSGAITGLGAGAGAAFTNAAFGAGAKLTIGQQVASYVGETVIGTTIDTVGAGIMNMVTTGNYSPGAFMQGVSDSWKMNLAGNAIGGLIGMKLAQSPRFQQMFTKFQNSSPIRGIMAAENAVFGRTLNFDGPNGLGGGFRNNGPETTTTTAPETTTTSTTKPPETTTPTNNTTPETTAPPKTPETTTPTNNTTPETTAPPKTPETTTPTNNTTPETTAPPKTPETTTPETTAPPKTPETRTPETTTKPPETRTPETTKPPETTSPETSTTKPPETTNPETTTKPAESRTAETGARTNNIPEGSMRGTELAEEMGYPKAPEGYHWANYDGKPVMRRNPGNAQSGEYPQLRYQPDSGRFEVVGTGTVVDGRYINEFLSDFKAPRNTGGTNNTGNGLDGDGYRIEAEGFTANTKNIEDVEITADGIEVVKQHLRQEYFTSGTKSGEWDHNEMMIQRLEQIARGDLEPTLQDKNFFAHEYGESSLMRQFMDEGMSIDDAYAKAHAIISKQYGVTGMNERSTFYTQEANDAFDSQIMRENDFGSSGGINSGGIKSGPEFRVIPRKKFTQASNVEQAADFARRSFGVQKVDYSTLDVEVANIVNQRLARLFREYRLANRIKSIVPHPNQNASSFMSVFKGEELRIGRLQTMQGAEHALNDLSTANGQQMFNNRFEGTESLLYGNNPTPEQMIGHTTTHEFGHFVQGDLEFRAGQGDANAQQLLDEFDQIWSGMSQTERNAIGNYAQRVYPSNPNGNEEAFAEMFAMYNQHNGFDAMQNLATKTGNGRGSRLEDSTLQSLNDYFSRLKSQHAVWRNEAKGGSNP